MTARRRRITRPGIYNLTAEVYHADPVPGGSLSSSGARRLLPPSCPAVFDHERQHGRPVRQVFEYGHAAHKLVLGVGPDIVTVDADDWKTRAAQDARKEARANGKTALLAHEVEQVHAMAAKLREHPTASALLRPGSGRPERSLFWQDERTGIWRRAMLDWLPNKPRKAGRRTVIPDYKTAESAEPGAFSKSAARFGYHQQDAWYRDALTAVRGDVDPALVFIVQEKAAPYLVTVVELDPVAKRIGAERNRRAIDLYAECTRTGRWPGYADDVALVGLPRWAEYEHEELMSA